MSRLVPVAFALWVAALAGCSDGLGLRQEVSGKVTLKGEPIQEGVIAFEPLDNPGVTEEATGSGDVIRNGAYHLPVEHGLLPGRYRVRITSGDGATPANSDEPPGPSTGKSNIVSKDRVPPEYNVNTRQEVEVKVGEKNQFDFHIP